MLAAGGLLVLVWNTRDVDDPLQGAIEGLLGPHRGAVSARFDDDWRSFVESSRLFGVSRAEDLRLRSAGDGVRTRRRVESTSFVATMPEAERQALLEQVRDLAAGREEPFSLPYRTEVFAIPRSSDRV